MERTEILHELPPPMLIDIALVVAAAADDAVPVAAMSIVVEVPISMFDMSMFVKESSKEREKGRNGPRLGGLRPGMRGGCEGEGCQHLQECLTTGNTRLTVSQIIINSETLLDHKDSNLGQLRGSY